MRTNKIILITFLSFFVFGSSLAWGRTKDLFMDPSKPVEVKTGEDFYLALAADPATGYSWKITASGDPALVKFIGDNYQPDSSGGAQWFRFLPQKAGETEIKLLYSLPTGSKETRVKEAAFKIKIS